MSLKENIIGFHHVSIKAQDLDATIRFYEEMGFTIVHEWSLPDFNMERCVMLFNSNIGYYLEICDADSEMPTQGRKRVDGDGYIENALLHICFVVKDVESAIRDAIAAGAKPLSDGAWEIDLRHGDKQVTVHNGLVYSPNGEVIEFLKAVVF